MIRPIAEPQSGLRCSGCLTFHAPGAFFGQVWAAGEPCSSTGCGGSLREVRPTTVTLGAMPAESGGRAARLDAAEQERVEREQSAGAWRIAERFGYDDVIDPRELRNALLSGLDLLESRLARPRSV